MTWQKTADELPPLDVPVCLYDPAPHQGMYWGARADEGDGWLWARCCGNPYWSNKHKRWECDDLEADDDQPTHWQPLPEPPAVDATNKDGDGG